MVVSTSRSRGSRGANQYRSPARKAPTPLLYVGTAAPQANNPAITPAKLAALSKGASRELVMIPSHPETPPGVLALLASNVARRAVAANPKTPPEALVLLADDHDQDTLRALAANPNIPPEALRKLSQNRDRWVRVAVASNPTCPAGICLSLSYDASPNVRYYTAQNHNTPPDALDRLSRSTDGAIQMAVAGNPSTSPTTLVRMLRRSPENAPGLRDALLANQALPDHIRAMWQLAH